MTRQEFEKRTGIYPSDQMYAAIEARYMADDTATKDAFCKAYKENTYGLAESIQQEIQAAEHQQSAHIREQLKAKDARIAQLSAQITKLQQSIEAQENWKPYQPSNYSDKQYEELSQFSGAAYMTDQEAIEWIEMEFGFLPTAIQIVHHLANYQKNSKNILREIGEVQRSPVYGSSDWNYARFNVKGWRYEVCDGVLQGYNG